MPEANSCPSSPFQSLREISVMKTKTPNGRLGELDVENASARAAKLIGMSLARGV
jgi:hypothetical protein